MYRIGELSKLSNIPVKTLRFYDMEGILPADFTDAFTGYRYYSASKLSDCYRILAFKELGFTLDEIREQFRMPREQLSRLIGEKESRLEEQKRQTEQKISLLRQIAATLKEDGTMFNVVVGKSEDIRVAYERKILSDQGESRAVLDDMRNRLPPGGLRGRTVVIDYETEYKSDGFDTGFGIEIGGRLPEADGFKEKTICFPEETASVVCRECEYREAVLALNRYIQSHPLQMVGPTYTILYEDGTVEIKIPVVRLFAEMRPPKNDNLDLPFVHDERVIGRWQLVDWLPSREQFHPHKRKSFIDGQRIRELYFLPGGERYWCFGWTKGYLLAQFGYPAQKGANAYTVEEIDRETYMFIEMKFHSYFFLGGKPEIWVLKKLDSRAYTKKDIMITDDIPDIPAEDDRVLGRWAVCALVRTPEEYEPHKADTRFPPGALFWKSAEFLRGGEMKNTFQPENGAEYIDTPENWRWVTGCVIGVPRSTVSLYVLQKRAQEEYLFIQWKSGDYTYGGEEPYWYVFKRA